MESESVQPLGSITMRYYTRDVICHVELADGEIRLRPEWTGDLAEFAARVASVLGRYPDTGHIEPAWK